MQPGSLGQALLDANLLGGGGAKVLLQGVVGLEQLSYADMPGNIVQGAAWSPDGNYLAVRCASADRLRVYAVNRTTGALTLIATYNATATVGLCWSPNGTRLAFLETSTLRVVAFDSVAETLTSLGTFSLGNTGYGLTFTVAGNKLIANQADPSSGAPRFRVLSFNNSTGAMASLRIADVFTEQAALLSMHSDGDRILALWDSSAVGSKRARIFNFVDATNVITYTSVSAEYGGSGVYPRWAENFTAVIVASGYSTSARDFVMSVYDYNKAGETLTLRARGQGMPTTRVAGVACADLRNGFYLLSVPHSTGEEGSAQLLWNRGSGIMPAYGADQAPGYGFLDFVMDPDGTFFAYGGYDAKVKIGRAVIGDFLLLHDGQHYWVGEGVV